MADKKYIAYDDAFHALDTVAMPLSTYECLVGRLVDIPAVDVAPVVKAMWLPFGKRGIYGMIYACSACHAKYDGITNYCPNCGAKMDGGDE